MDPFYPRTLAEFQLSLSLSSIFYHDKTEGDTIIMPGMLMFGDETQSEEIQLTVSTCTCTCVCQFIGYCNCNICF